MKDVDIKAQHDIPDLRKRLSELLDLAREIVRENRSIPEDDHFELMGLCFLNKQIEQTQSIVILIDKGYEMDAQIIVRSMLEGLAQLMWAARDAQNLALRWRSFTYVEEWRSIQRKKEANEPIDKNRQSIIEKALSVYGVLHLTKSAKVRKDQNKPLPRDPYHKHWFGHDFSYLFKQIEGDAVYRYIYRPFTAWHHWSPISFERAIVSKDDVPLYCSSSPATAATALASALLALSQTAELINSHLKLDFSSRLKKAHDELISWYNEQNK